MVTVMLQDAVAAELSARAATQGVTLEVYLAALAASAPRSEQPAGADIERLLDEASVAGPSGTGTYPRADIYVDHD